MRRFITTLACLLFFSIGISQAIADTMGEQWTVDEASGTVTIRSASGEMLSTKAGTQLIAPFTIMTGAGGRVVVSHHLDRITVGENSQSTITQPKHAGASIFTVIKQTLGSVLYEVEHRVKDSFEVDTPYLVSVVKGTTFNIHVTQSASSVSLVEGRLLVYTPDRKSELMLTPGQVAIKSIHSIGIILKDQQSLSEPVQGRITVVKDSNAPASMLSAGASNTGRSNAGVKAANVVPLTAIGNPVDMDRGRSAANLSTKHGDAPASVLSAGASNARGSTASVKASNVVPLTAIGNPVDVNRGQSAANLNTKLGNSLIDIGASAARVPAGVGIGGGAAVGLGASVPGVAKGSGISAGSAINLGANAPSLSTSVNVGGTGAIDLGATVSGVSARTNIGAGSMANVNASVPGASAGAALGGGSVLDVGTSVPGVSTSANISSGGVNLSTSVPSVSASVNAGSGAVHIGTSASTGSTTSTSLRTTVGNITTRMPVSSPIHPLGK